MKSMLLLLTAFGLSQNLLAQPQSQLGNTDNIVNAAANSTTGLIATLLKKDIPKDSIAGRCEYRGSGCNGASVSLLKDDKELYKMTLTSGDFKIPTLKINETYSLKLTWEKHKISETMDVKTGQFVQFKLTSQLEHSK